MDVNASNVSWEYKIARLGLSSSLSSERLLNQLGAEGWDLGRLADGVYSTRVSPGGVTS